MKLTVKTLSQEVRRSRSLPLYRNISFPDQNLGKKIFFFEHPIFHQTNKQIIKNLSIDIFPEVQVFVIGPKVALNETPQFVTNDVSVDFSLDIISTKNTSTFLTHLFSKPLNREFTQYSFTFNELSNKGTWQDRVYQTYFAS